LSIKISPKAMSFYPASNQFVVVVIN